MCDGAPLQLQLFATDIQPLPHALQQDVTVAFTVACHGWCSGVSLLLGLQPEAEGDAPSHLVLCSEAGRCGTVDASCTAMLCINATVISAL